MLLALAGLTWATAPRERSHAGADAPAPLLKIDPGRAEAIEIALGEERVRFERVAAGWLASSSAGVRAADGEVVRAALRLLAEARGTAEPGALAPGGPSVTLELDGTATRIDLEPAGLGPSVRASVDGASPARVPADLARAFTPAAAAAWVSPALFPLGAGDASEVRLASDSGSLLLRRAGERWSIVEPAPMPAHAPAVRDLLRALGGLASDRPAPMDSAAEPVASIAISTDRSRWEGEDARRETIVQTLDVLSSAAADGSSVLVRAGARATAPAPAPIWGPQAFIADAAPLEKISLDPSAYASRVALMMPAADVRRVRLVGGAGATPRVYSRGIEGWTDDTGGSADSARINALVAFLAGEPGDSVRLGEPEGVQWLISIDLGPDERGAESLRLGRLSGEADAPVVIHAGRRWIMATSEAARGAFASAESLAR